MNLFFSAGEASGDMYAARLMQEIQSLRPGLVYRTAAIGGKKLKAQGAMMVADSSKWGAIGITESLRVAPRVLRSFVQAKRAIRFTEPGLFVPVDFGFVNLRLCRYARERDWKVLYFIPPGSWRRSSHSENLPEVTDEIVTPFSWSSSYLNSIGAHAHWFGHPLKQIVEEDTRPFEQADSVRIAMLPGSRMHEVKLNMPVMARAVANLPPGAVLEFAVASSVGRNQVVDLWKKHMKGRQQVVFTEGDTIGVFKRARAAIVCSGSATLEAALCKCPMVVIYRLSRAAVIEARILRVRPQFIALPNIVMNRAIVPELIQSQAKPSAIALYAQKLAADGTDRDNQLYSLQQVDNELGSSDAITKTASLAISMA